MDIEQSLQTLESLAQKHGLNRPFIVGGMPRDREVDPEGGFSDIDVTTGNKDIHALAQVFADAVGEQARWLNDHYMVVHNGMRYDFSKHETPEELDGLLSKLGIKNPTPMQKEVYGRDFTINTLMIPTSLGDPIDITGRALKDIQDRIIDCPINCDVSFRFDPRRILRAYYFKAKLGFTFSEDLTKAIQTNLPLLADVNARYAGDILNKMVRKAPDILDQLIDDGVFKYIEPTKFLTKELVNRKRILDVMEPKTATMPVIRKNLDYGEGWQKKVDEYREDQPANDGKASKKKKKKKKSDRPDDSPLGYFPDLETEEYHDKPRNRKYWKEMGDSPAAKEFQEYAKILKTKRSLPVLNKEARIRGPGVRECPFGLPITLACKNAGDSVDQMTAIVDNDPAKQERQRKANRRVYVYNQTGERCVYADKIVEGKDRVHCDWGEAGQRMSDFPLRPSPFYPRVFHGLGQYGLYSYPINEYTDNHGARQLFTGIFSLYASTGEVLINKRSFKPDPVLEKLADDLVIKDE